MRGIGALLHFQACLVTYGGQFPQLEETLFLGVNQQPFIINYHLPIMGFESQRRAASSIKARRLNLSATESPGYYGEDKFVLN